MLGLPEVNLVLGAYVLSGFVVGVLIGLTGIGGGSILTPLLVTVFGQSPAVSVGTDLAFAAGTKLVATASRDFRRRVDWPIVGYLALGSLPGAMLVVFWFNAQSAASSNSVVVEALALVLAATAMALLLRPRLRALGLSATTALLKDIRQYQAAATVCVGALLGVAVALTSVGAGALGTTALVLLYPLRLSTDRLVATDIAHALPLAILAGCGHLVLGHVNLTLLVALLVGSVPGVLLGSRLAGRISDTVLRGLLATALAVSAWRLVTQ